MGKPSASKKKPTRVKKQSTVYRTRRKTKDIDQIHEDMKPGTAAKLLSQEVDLDLPGSGQFYCLHCAKHFISEEALKKHFRGKPHKKRLKELQDEPYTQAEADRAAGMGNYKAPGKVKVTTQDVKEKMDTVDVEEKSL
ncbi:hypothetical protein CAPTEDRAFT_132341 [Capitella teleta]|uniref:C2H2-type domain-containing protein n=1 Tax=Capitella teleta TaxID=283909 RepID=R7TPK2_CAPTE|nr:hypothetical protein CAPTEDRAFT_132341 [Capitella teleta]|eukprot:ELT95497.1 hypothetical protein CAPTEDRAFT_132341 [Capitella teleta]